MGKRFLDYETVASHAYKAAVHIADRWPGGHLLYGVPRGGVIPAYMVSQALRCLGCAAKVTLDPHEASIFIDDILDSGKTAERYRLLDPGTPFLVLFDKTKAPWKGEWLVMPWEDQSVGGPEDAVVRLIQHVGDDPDREGLQETPARVVRAWEEWGAGYKQDPADVLKVFQDGAEGCDEMVVVKDIPLVSTCEHHLAPFMGIAHIGYIPNGKVVGLSKFARLVEVFSRRLQVQERLTTQIVDALVEHTGCLGAGVVVQCEHTCMSTRGVRVHGSTTVTSALRGVMKDKPEARAEFLALCYK